MNLYPVLNFIDISSHRGVLSILLFYIILHYSSHYTFASVCGTMCGTSHVIISLPSYLSKILWLNYQSSLHYDWFSATMTCPTYILGASWRLWIQVILFMMIYLVSFFRMQIWIGAPLVVNSSWKNPSGEWHVGCKLVYELFTKDLTSRLKVLPNWNLFFLFPCVWWIFNLVTLRTLQSIPSENVSVMGRKRGRKCGMKRIRKQ